MRPGAAAAVFLIAAVFSACPGPRQGNVIVLCAGDSLTEQGYPRPLENLLQREGVRARVLNYGRSGFTSGEYLRFARERRLDLEKERPDLILLQLGTNDVRLDGDHTPVGEFEDNMRRVIGILSALKTRWGGRPRLFLGTVPPVPEDVGFPFTPASSARVRDEINPLIVRLAGELGLVLVDNTTVFEEAPRLLADVHPTAEGYRRMASSWLAAVKPYLPK